MADAQTRGLFYDQSSDVWERSLVVLDVVRQRRRSDRQPTGKPAGTVPRLEARAAIDGLFRDGPLFARRAAGRAG